MLADIIACGIAAGAFAALGILLVNGKCLTLDQHGSHCACDLRGPVGGYLCEYG